MTPSVGSIRRLTILRVVVLTQPDEPRMTRVSPRIRLEREILDGIGTAAIKCFGNTGQSNHGLNDDPVERMSGCEFLNKLSKNDKLC